MNRYCWMTTCALLLVHPLLGDEPTARQTYGDLRGRFVYDGERPEQKRIEVTADRDAMGDLDIFDESLVIHPENHGIANICVWMYRKQDEDAPPIHPSYDLNPNMDAEVVRRTLTAAKGRFDPHIVLLRTGEELNYTNGDRVGYCPKIETEENPISPILPPGGDMTYTYERAQRLPCRVTCSIHPWMLSWVIIQDHPYMAVSDEDGRFEIKNIPVGEWTFQFWHERVGYIREVKIDGKEVEWPRGRKSVTIDTMPTDIGMVNISPNLFVE